MSSTTNDSEFLESVVSTGPTPGTAVTPSAVDPTPPIDPTTPVDPTLFNLYDTLYLDSQQDKTSGSWRYTITADLNTPAEQVEPMGAEATAPDSDSWKKYCFVVVKKRYKLRGRSEEIITFQIFVTSPYLIKACRDVMADLHGVSWESEPIKLDPKTLIAYFPLLEKYEKDLANGTDRTEEDDHVLKSVRSLLAHMRKHYQKTLERIASLVKNHEITFDLLYAILLPGTVIIQRCPVTGELHALKLLAGGEVSSNSEQFYMLACEYLEVSKSEGRHSSGWADSIIQFGMSSDCTRIKQFAGVEKINSLSAYPIDFHKNALELKDELIRRAKKWVSLSGIHHMDYQGNAGRREGDKFRRYSVHSRIMVDKASFSRINANYCLPVPERVFPAHNEDQVYGLADDVLLLAPAIVYGFSLADKLWLEFNINHVAQIVWNEEAFAELVLPPERKKLLRGLVVAHEELDTEDPTRFDDFVLGKGRGLIVNLFGPPGVGKTLSAEATSEHLRRPLYIMSSSDLGTNAPKLDYALREAFDLAATWHAVLLIDEADVFLEERSLHDIGRNAMVAVFLRQLEYYQGILFLTTNRIRTFDEAFLSRIHVSLHFDELSREAKEKIWKAFLRKAGIELNEGLLSLLVARNINGRQIKNACSTATSLAASTSEKTGYKHLEVVLDAMEDFMKYFEFKPEQVTDQPPEIGKDTTNEPERITDQPPEIGEDTTNKPEQITERPPEIGEDTTNVRSGTWWGKRLVYHVRTYLVGTRST